MKPTSVQVIFLEKKQVLGHILKLLNHSPKNCGIFHFLNSWPLLRILCVFSVDLVFKEEMNLMLKVY